MFTVSSTKAKRIQLTASIQWPDRWYNVLRNTHLAEKFVKKGTNIHLNVLTNTESEVKDKTKITEKKCIRVEFITFSLKEPIILSSMQLGPFYLLSYSGIFN